MRRAKQKDFFEGKREHGPGRISHGGESSARRRKINRPLDRKKPIHLVLKSAHAKGPLSLLGVKNQIFVERTLKKWSQHFQITIHSWQNVGNHIHIVCSFSQPDSVRNFLRTVAALIARQVTGARRGKPFGKRFWDHLAFSRIAMGRADFKRMENYVYKNKLEVDYGYLARKTVEMYEAAEREARKAGRNVWEILESS